MVQKEKRRSTRSSPRLRKDITETSENGQNETTAPTLNSLSPNEVEGTDTSQTDMVIDVVESGKLIEESGGSLNHLLTNPNEST